MKAGHYYEAGKDIARGKGFLHQSEFVAPHQAYCCLLYTSDAADE